MRVSILVRGGGDGYREGMKERFDRYEFRTPMSTRLASAAKAERRCSKPGCSTLGFVSMSYDYANRAVFVGQLIDERHPAFYDLCRVHLDSLVPPRGWTLRRQPLSAVGSGNPLDWSFGNPTTPYGTTRSTGWTGEP